MVQGCGQFCTNPGLVIGIASPAFSLFVANLIAEIGQRPPQTMLNAGTLGGYEARPGCAARPPGTETPGRPAAEGQARPAAVPGRCPLLLEGDRLLREEVFGPVTVVVEVADKAEADRALHGLRGPADRRPDRRAGGSGDPWRPAAAAGAEGRRVLFNSYPTGVEVYDAMVHGGPYPATSDARGTSGRQPGHRPFPAPSVLPELPGRPPPDA